MLCWMADRISGFDGVANRGGYLLLICAVAVIVTVGHAQDIDNAMIGEPEVRCNADSVDLQFRAKKVFKGKVFVKGHYADAGCRIDYNDEGSTEKPNGGIIIHHGACDMERQRMLSPQGMQFSAVIVISFHPVFITKVDRAYHVKCMYRELEKTVTASLDVSALTTLVIEQTLPMPECTYTIRKDQIDGEILKYARVGEQVVHRWECDTDVYGILVHTCYVEDGQGDKVVVVDENGCHTDRYILGDPTYVEKLNMAYRESHVFKFADRVAVRFQCQIRLCLKAEDGCKGITPPLCESPIDSGTAAITSGDFNSTDSESTISGSFNGTNSPTTSGNDTLLRLVRRRAERDVIRPHFGSQEDYLDDRLRFEPIDGDFNSQYIYVLDSTESPDKGSSRDQESWSQFLSRTGNGAIVGELRQNVCMSTLTFGVLLVVVVTMFVSVALVALFLMFQRARHRRQEKKLLDGDRSGMFGGLFAGQSGVSNGGLSASDSIDAYRPPPYGTHLASIWNNGTGKN